MAVIKTDGFPRPLTLSDEVLKYKELPIIENKDKRQEVLTNAIKIAAQIKRR
ncbi:hypothetical protein ACTHPT_14080 [Bacillus altitudinis]|uniref:hypothetical protein n=1 Tax=Bacillus altitudinis TaxID=293387 RepID=UPI003F7CA9C6